MAKSTERTWRDTRGNMVAVPVCNGDTLRDKLQHSDALSRFASRVGLNYYPGASGRLPSCWMIDPLRGRPNWMRLRCRLNGAGSLPSCLYRVRTNQR